MFILNTLFVFAYLFLMKDKIANEKKTFLHHVKYVNIQNILAIRVFCDQWKSPHCKSSLLVYEK